MEKVVTTVYSGRNTTGGGRGVGVVEDVAFGVLGGHGLYKRSKEERDGIALKAQLKIW